MTKKIALTFDDAPLGDGTLFSGVERTNVLIDALESRGVEATIYVTARDFSLPNAEARIAAYNDAGHLIANHTNTHPAASETAVEDYFAEVDLVTDLLEDYSNYRSWFRFPFLDEGTTYEIRDAYRAALDERGLSNGYVTVDTFDWHLQSRLDDAIMGGESYDMDAVRDAYVDMIVSSANHFDAIGQDTFGRSPAHVLLLHENDVAAMFIDDAIDALRADGWEIISADEAYQDPIASMETETLAVGAGKVAALAIDNGADYSILSHEGNTTEGVDALLEEHGAFHSVPHSGTPGDDYITGSDGNDVIVSLQGEDVVRGSKGNDQIDLGDTYDQMDYAGLSTDYQMVRNADGSITVTKPGGGIDTLKGVDGFWFIDEERWYDAAELVPYDQNTDITPGDDLIYGTAGDDVIVSLEGEDTVVGSTGNDSIYLGDGYDQIDYAGSAADYVFTRQSADTVYVTKPDGSVDLLEGVDGIWFLDEERWYDMTELTPATEVTGITSGDDTIYATNGDDVIESLEGEDTVIGSAGNDRITLGDGYDQVDYEGSASDYTFIRNDDDTISVIKPGGETGDVLSGVDGFWFTGEERWYDAEELAPPSHIIGITPGDDYVVGTGGDDEIISLEGEDVVRGTSGNDTIRLGDGYDQVDYLGNSSDYAMTRNADGTITVEKPDGSVDTLEGVDGFWFTGDEQWYSADELAGSPSPSNDLFVAEKSAPPSSSDADLAFTTHTDISDPAPASYDMAWLMPEDDLTTPDHASMFGLQDDMF